MGFQGKNVGMFQGRFKERNAEMYPVNSAKMFRANNARMFPGSNVKMFRNKNVETCPGNNVETSQDKSAAKLAMVANNYSQNMHRYTEQPVVIFSSPISILQNK